MARVRLDLALEARKLLPSRARARDAILRGTVSVNGAPVLRPSQPVDDGDDIRLDDPAAGYVSRAALKLIAGLEAGGIVVAGRTCLDLGASTGGFTQVLLERGAAKIYAVDVGHGQLDNRLRENRKVVVLERQNARDLTRAQIPDAIDLLTCDVSFVSVAKVLAAPLALCGPGADAVILVKPQFEVGPNFVGGGGIVTNAGAVAAAVADIVAFMARQDFVHILSVPSPIAGGDGNRETIAAFRQGLGYDISANAD